MDIYKVTDKQLSDIEQKVNVIAIKPIMGNELTAKAYFDYVLPEYNTSGKLLSPPELGCTLSHIQIYNSVIASNTPAIILENDIEPIIDHLTEALAICSKSDKDFIHLGWHPNTERGIFFRGICDNGFYRIDANNNFHGTFAYFISVEAAKQLAKYHQNSIKLADSWAQFFMQTDIKPFFKPIFTHPPQRSDMHKQRMSVSSSVYNLALPSLWFYAKKLLKQKLCKLQFWNKAIKPHN